MELEFYSSNGPPVAAPGGSAEMEAQLAAKGEEIASLKAALAALQQNGAPAAPDGKEREGAPGSGGLHGRVDPPCLLVYA
jgi:hypothetical protein